MPYTGSQGMTHIGLLLYVGDGNSEETFELIAELTKAPDPDPTVEVADFTNFDSVNGVREKKPSLIDPGTMAFSVNWIKASYVKFRTLQFARSIVGWKFVHPDTAETVELIQGFVTKAKENLNLDGPSTIDVEIQLTGVLEIDPA